EAMHRIEDLLNEKSTTEQQIKKHYKDLDEAEIWGNFSPRAVANLQETTGLKIHYMTASQKAYQESWEQAYPIYEISEIHGSIYFVYVQSEEEMPTLEGVTEMPAPKFSYSYKKREIIILEARLDDIVHELEDMYIYLSTLEEEKLNYMNRLSFDSNKENAKKEAEEHIRIVEGYVPQSKRVDFESFLDSQHIIYLQSSAMEAAMAGENVPVLLKNNAFARLFEPITELFALPSYTEMDLTPLFAPFFMMFFGFCFGDAGYGIFLLVLSTILKFKLAPKMKPFCTLAQYFGLATIFFGLLSGTFFGISLVEVPALVKFKQYFLNSDNMMVLSLLLGGVQILFGMFIQILNIKRRQGLRHAISRIGWFSLLLLAVPLVAASLLKYTLLPIVNYAIYGGMGVSLCLVFFFNSPGKNIFMNFGGGLWDAYNVITGLVGDLLSYIRLFALGLTGGILGSVFNTLAMGTNHHGRQWTLDLG
ncbi:MAG: V-type ATPase 116kDa subunit family protein, partial [Bacteroidales bacterium]